MASRRRQRSKLCDSRKAHHAPFSFKSVSNVGPDVVNPGARPHADLQPPPWNSLARLCVRPLARPLIGRRIAVRPSADTTVGPGWRGGQALQGRQRRWLTESQGGCDGGGPQMRWEFVIYARQEEKRLPRAGCYSQRRRETQKPNEKFMDMQLRDCRRRQRLLKIQSGKREPPGTAGQSCLGVCVLSSLATVPQESEL